MTTKVIVDDELGTRLGGLNEQAELCDQAGRTLGRFVPEEEYHKWLYDSVEIPFSDEEIERRRSETSGRELKEIWKSLGRT